MDVTVTFPSGVPIVRLIAATENIFEGWACGSIQGRRYGFAFV